MRERMAYTDVEWLALHTPGLLEGSPKKAVRVWRGVTRVVMGRTIRCVDITRSRDNDVRVHFSDGSSLLVHGG